MLTKEGGKKVAVPKCSSIFAWFTPLSLFKSAAWFKLALAWSTIGNTSSAELHSELLFPLQNKHVHSSSLVELPNGDLLACWFHGSGERTANDVSIQGSRLSKGARQWNPIFEMADTPQLPDCNPTLFLDAQQRLWMFWVVPHGQLPVI